MTCSKPARIQRWWWIAGSTLVGLHLWLVVLSRNFSYDEVLRTRPIVALVCLEILAGVVYLFSITLVRSSANSKRILIGAIAVGLLLRIAASLSTPALEDDYYRYLWDGAVVAHGYNPYSLAPSEALAAREGDGPAPAGLRRLALESGPVLERVNHPDLRTIYPPVTQAAFALAYLLGPWKLVAWRLVLLGFDVATLGLLLRILYRANLPLLWMIVYWWNPILVKETFNSGHMDVLAFPFIMGSILLAVRGKHLGSLMCLILAAGTKLWPLLLLPVILRPLLRQPRRLITALLLLVLMASALFLPVYQSGLGRDSGFVAYQQNWEMNDALFMVILWAFQALTRGIMNVDAATIARWFVAVSLLAWAFWSARREAKEIEGICAAWIGIIAAAFFLSPTQFPWYYLWMVPLLAIRPVRSLLLLSALMPLYYLRFYFNIRHQVGIFDHGIVWLEYIPVWALLIRDWLVSRRGSTGSVMRMAV